MESVLERIFPEKNGQTKHGFVEHQNLQFLYQILRLDTIVSSQLIQGVQEKVKKK